MPYQFRQTGAEIQDILDQVGVNTTDIAQNAQDISTLNSNLTNINARFAGYTSGSVNDIKTSGIFFVGNSVTDKPNGTGPGTGGMLIVAYFAADNLVRLFIPNRNVSGSRGIWFSGVTGGTALSWVQLC